MELTLHTLPLSFRQYGQGCVQSNTKLLQNWKQSNADNIISKYSRQWLILEKIQFFK